MRTKLKFGLAEMKGYAPKWLINTTSVVAILLTAKHYLVQGLPSMTDEIKVITGLWVDYVLNVIQVVLALAVIFTSEKNAN